MRLDHALDPNLRQVTAWSAQNTAPSSGHALDPASDPASPAAQAADRPMALTEPSIRFLLLTAQIAWLGLMAFLYLG